MALVDYSSSDSADEDSGPDSRRIKRRKCADGTAAHSSRTSDTTRTPSNPAADAGQVKDAEASSMPPLPDTFHDLYASTVRQSVVDDPSLHQGRKRQVPHVVGNWPSHLYAEWHPSTTQHALLTELLADIEKQASGEIELLNFLTSDLGSPLPLHISLSRPLSLSTGNKDEFLERITQMFTNSGIAPFIVRPRGLAWYRSPDSDRTFLILRVASDASKAGSDSKEVVRTPNPELTALLAKSNTIAAQFDQPTLYQRNANDLDTRDAVGTAFHISIGWTFHLPGDKLSLETLSLFKQCKFDGIRGWEINVTGIKAKIGNVVNHIALKESGRGTAPLLGSVPFI
ncbi:U6 snRNA phosphodiesterase [Fusarium sp. LHS14.1]|nr:U6 snRNA phosphodiesterase [Fusarium sp. LHS14.1]